MPSGDEEKQAPVELQLSQDSASLLKRLAGPSSGKAGLTKDQTDINRIIADASKGSKFYENEKRKDKDLTEKIAKILKERDEVMRNANLQKVEHNVDRLIAELESGRDLSQVIVHVDMDAFFANVELLHNPELKGKPFGVGRGVLTTASYEARKFGVRSGMAGFVAKKLCPELILLPIHHTRYSEMSDRVMAIFVRYDPNMCPAGCDEGYLNITEYCAEHNIDPEECVQEMRKTVFEETNLTVSAGIAPNTMLAKICSDKNKPNGQFYLPFESKAITEFMKDLSIRKIPGIGRVAERLLESIGIQTCGDIFTQRGVISLMDKHFGLHHLLQTYLGIACNVVKPHSREERKSIGAERTFNPIKDKNEILRKLEEVAVELEHDMNEGGWTGRTVTLKYKLDTYQVFTRAKSFDRWVTKKEELFAAGKELLLPELPLNLRLIGLRLTKLKDLKASADPEISIKRFFSTADGTVNDGNAKKRRKMNQSHGVTYLSEDDADRADIPSPQGQSSSGHAEALENEKSDEELVSASMNTNGKSRSRPPVSAGLPRTVAIQGIRLSEKPKSIGSAPTQHSSNEEIDHIETPTTCGPEVNTDQGLYSKRKLKAETASRENRV
ncbi:DNA/RNA polymerase [Marasmius fiardii PR-910]|nr:DNA/RNA polymerase [Marasmius fiardii PR-910]